MEFLGEQKLIQQAKVGFPKGITKICDDVYFFLGYGGSTCILVVGDSSCLLIDTLNGLGVATEALAEIKKISDKPIKNIIYTHYTHFDHTGGATVFTDDNPEIYGHKPVYAQYKHTELIKDICQIRGARQFGRGLTPQEIISVGVGPINDNNGKQGHLKCTKLLEDDVTTLNLDGIEVVIVATAGETDDQIFVYLPKYEVLCCGDNFYESWPNLYAIRGSQYRDVSSWVDALRRMISYNPKYLLPGHTRPIIGKENVKETLTNYADALEYVLIKTLEGMNQGKTPDELVEEIKLPEHFAKLSYLQEYYGTVAWSIRSIFDGYLGWYDGNPTHLGSMKKKDKALKTIKMMNGAENIISEINRAITEHEEQWALELCDILLDANIEVDTAKKLKATALYILGRMQTSANGRHYYLSVSKYLSGDMEPAKLSGFGADARKRH
ncbi:MBL fold hydrolase [Epulopiscium sp. SCG-B10WGA-EpuloA2]|nr:MBL fold hydrolase [Epulopiscium sp. SCG-B10WGA-EpuloA2]